VSGRPSGKESSGFNFNQLSNCFEKLEHFGIATKYLAVKKCASFLVRGLC